MAYKCEPPPDRERTPPSHRYKWHKMMGATNLLPDEEREAIRQAKQRAETEEERGYDPARDGFLVRVFMPIEPQRYSAKLLSVDQVVRHEPVADALKRPAPPSWIGVTPI